MTLTAKGFPYPQDPDIPDVPYWNQQLAAAGDQHVQTFYAAQASSSQLFSAVAAADVAGMSVTFTTARPNARALIVASVDCLVQTAGSAVSALIIVVDGSNAVGGSGLFRLLTANDRNTVALCAVVTLAAAGSHTVKVQASLNITGGTLQVSASGGSNLTVQLQEM